MKIEVKYGKDLLKLDLPATATVGDLKTELAKLTRVPTTVQTLTGKPNLKDNDIALLGAGGLGWADAGVHRLLLIGTAVATAQRSEENKAETAKRERKFRQFPAPFYRMPPVCGLLADAFCEGKQGVEGGSPSAALLVLDLLFSRINRLGVSQGVITQILAGTAGGVPLPADAFHPFLSKATTATQTAGVKTSVGDDDDAAAAAPAVATTTTTSPISTEAALGIVKTQQVVRNALELAQPIFSLTKPDQIVPLIDTIASKLNALPMGEWLLLPIGYVGMKSQAFMYLLVTPEKPGATSAAATTGGNAAPNSSGSFTVVFCNRGTGLLDYHPGIATKTMLYGRATVRFPGVSRARMTDRGWWTIALSQLMKTNDPQVVSEYNRVEVIYDVLLPWLVEDKGSALDFGKLSAMMSTEKPQNHDEQKQLAAAGMDIAAGLLFDSNADPAFEPRAISESSAVLSLTSAVNYLLRSYRVPEAMLPMFNLCLQLEAARRSAEELVLDAQRWVPLPGTNKDGTVVVPEIVGGLPAFERSIKRLAACEGVEPNDAKLSISMLFDAIGNEYIKSNSGQPLPPSSFEGKTVAVYFGGKFCGPCRRFKPMLLEAVQRIKNRLAKERGRGTFFELIFISCDRSAEDFAEFSKGAPWCYLAPHAVATKAAVEAFDVTGVPALFLFSPADGSLLTRDGVSALRADPEAVRFPNAPWTGARKLSQTDSHMLRYICHGLAHRTAQLLDSGDLTQQQATKIDELASAIRDLTARSPTAPLDASQATPKHQDAPASAESKAVDQLRKPPVAAATAADSSASSIATAELAKKDQNNNNDEADDDGDSSENVVAGWPLTDKLLNRNVDAYVGRRYKTELPELGLMSGFRGPAQSMAEVFSLIDRASKAVAGMNNRSRNSGTSSRVALQMSMIEFISHVFLRCLPVPAPPGSPAHTAASPYSQSFASVPAPPALPAAALPPGISPAAAAPANFDPQLQMLNAISQMLLALTTAWQAIEVPTRAYDSERALTAMAIQCVFDALLRNPLGAKQCATLAQMLGEDGGYRLCTKACRRGQEFEDLSEHFELVRPWMLPVRARLIEYIKGCKETLRQELLDFQMPDKLELRKHSSTVLFMRAFCERCQIPIMPRRDDPAAGMFQPQNEMEALMNLFCDSRFRTPLGRSHPEFMLLRDLVLLCRFLVTLEMREAQLLSKRKNMEEFTTWRLAFDEDGPGRQMSAGWRTRPQSPVFELLMVRGRDMDVADVSVRGFGDREVEWGEGLVCNSPIDVAGRIGVESATEDDVLHAKSLPTFGGATTSEESELLLSYLTVPYLRIPLILEFFSTQDRHTYLLSTDLQAVLRAALFEPGAFVTQAAIDAERGRALDQLSIPLRLSARQRQEVEMAKFMNVVTNKRDTTLLLGTTEGLLLNELCHQRPQTVMQPLIHFLDTVKELGPASVYSTNASYVLYLVQLVTGVLAFARFALETGRSNAPDVLRSLEAKLLASLTELVLPLMHRWINEALAEDDTTTFCVVQAHRALVHRVLMDAQCGSTNSNNNNNNANNEAQQQQQQLRESQLHATAFLSACAVVRARHGFGLGMLRTQIAKSQQDADLAPEDRLLRFLQAQGLDTARVSREQLERGRKLMSSGGRRRAIFVQIRSRFYNDTVRIPNLMQVDADSADSCRKLHLPPVDMPEHMLFAMLQDEELRILSLIDDEDKQQPQQSQQSAAATSSALTTTTTASCAASSSFSAALRQRLLDAIVRNVIHRKDGALSATGAVASNAVSAGEGNAADSMSASTTKDWQRIQSGIYKKNDGSGLVVSLTTCETFWRNDELRPVPDSMSSNPDYEAVLGNDARQCGLVQRSEHRHWVHVVGTPYDLAEWDAHDPRDQAEGAPKGSPEAFHFDGVFFNRPLDVYDEAPWSVRSERWAVKAVIDVIMAAYPPEQGVEFKAKLMLPALENNTNTITASAAATTTATSTSTTAATAVAAPVEEEEDVPILRVIYNDLLQYVEEEDEESEDNGDDEDAATPPGRGGGAAARVAAQRGGARGGGRGGARGGRGRGGRGPVDPMQQQMEEENRNRQTWKEIVVTRLAGTNQPLVRVYNLVPFARRCFRVLVYASDATLSQHGMAPMLSKRGAATLDLLRFHAGDLKRRIQHETTLEIHRYNAGLGGRETYVPPRLLQGLLPSVVLENFMYWLGQDDVLRGESTVTDKNDSWFSYKIEMYLPRSSSASASSSSSALIVRRPASVPFTLIDRTRAKPHLLIATGNKNQQQLTPARGSSAGRSINNNSAGRMKQASSTTDFLTINRTASMEDMQSAGGGQPQQRISDLNLALLQSVYPSLTAAFCRFLLQDCTDSVSAAVAIVESETGLEQCIERWEAANATTTTTTAVAVSSAAGGGQSASKDDDAESASPEQVLQRESGMLGKHAGSANMPRGDSFVHETELDASGFVHDVAADANGSVNSNSATRRRKRKTASYSDEFVLFNGVDWLPLADLAQQLSKRMEDASHTLLWGRAPKPLAKWDGSTTPVSQDGVPTASGAAAAASSSSTSSSSKKYAADVWKWLMMNKQSSKNKKNNNQQQPAQTETAAAAAAATASEDYAPAEPLGIDLIELPRMRIRFVPGLGPEQESTTAAAHSVKNHQARYLHIADATAWWMCEVCLPESVCKKKKTTNSSNNNNNNNNNNNLLQADTASASAAVAAASKEDTFGLPLALVDMVHKLAAPFGGQYVLLRNAAKEMQLLAPNHEFHPLGVKGDPFALFVLADRGSLTWQESVNTPYYLYGVHTSATFLLPPTLASALYLVVSLLARRMYALALRYSEGCYVDTRFTVEERFMFGLVQRTVEQDMHPNAHALRLKLAHTVLMSDNSIEGWQLHTEVTKYLAKLAFVSSDCRLSAEETIDVMKRCERASPLVKAQIAFWFHCSRNEDAAGDTRLKAQPPVPKLCGQPWAKLLMLPKDAVMNNTARPKRLHYQLPKKLPWSEEELIKAVWDDELLMDEESGSNRQLGFGFLFELASARRGLVPITVAGSDVSSSVTELLVRLFHLRHSRWGRDSVEDGETDHVQSYGMAMLATMLLDPVSRYPTLDTRDQRAALHGGVNLNGPEARESGIFDWWERCTFMMNKAYGSDGAMPRLSRECRQAQQRAVQAEEMRAAAISPLAVSDADRKALRKRGRPFPANTGQSLLTLPVSDDAGAPICRALCNVPLSDAKFDNLVRTTVVEKHVDASVSSPVATGGGAAATAASLLPFPNLAQHPAARTHIAQDMLQRLEGDMATYHEQQRKTKKHHLTVPGDSTTVMSFDLLFADISSSSAAAKATTSETPQQRRANFIAALTALYDRLAALAETDQNQVAAGVAKALRLANTEHVSEQSRAAAAASSTDGAAPAVKDPAAELRSRLSKHEQRVRPLTFEWLCGAVLSTEFASDVHSANPSHGSIDELLLMLVSTMLRANRVRFAQLAMQQITSLLTFIALCEIKLRSEAAAGSSPASASSSPSFGDGGGGHADALLSHAAMATRYDLLSSHLLQSLTASRQYTQTTNNNNSSSSSNNSNNNNSSSSNNSNNNNSSSSSNGAPNQVTMDPRFLIFEFLFSILLRPRQVEMVNFFIESVRSRNQSRVQQMIMGQGKTTVVGPLLCLILADQKTLVTQVTPTALLEQTRNVLRRSFSVVVPKKILTLSFDRTWGADSGSASDTGGYSLAKVEMLLQKLSAARSSGAVIVSAPECIKALELKLVEMLHAVEEATVSSSATSSPVDAITEDGAGTGAAAASNGNSTSSSSSMQVHGGISEILHDLQRASAGKASAREVEELEQLKKRLIARAKTSDTLAPIVADLWQRNGVLLMDEVDVLLHPLKSELNFPIGHKHPLDGSGPRWTLPIHLLDVIVACTKTGRPAFSELVYASPSGSSQNLTNEAASAMSRVASAVQVGFAKQKLQREPHLVLLDISFYHDTLAPALMPWLMLWVDHMLFGLDEMGERVGMRRSASSSGDNNNNNLNKAKKFAQQEAAAAEFIALTTAPSTTMADKMHGFFSPAQMQVLNLARTWMQTILPHVLSKISRVGFGLLQPSDEQMLKSLTSSDGGGGDSSSSTGGIGSSVSRKLLAVPFVAKDVPSRSSEFAHPDVVIGLTVLAFRYEGLRKKDVRDVVAQLQEDAARQHGPRERRPAAVLYNSWMTLAMQEQNRRQSNAAAAAIERSNSNNSSLGARRASIGGLDQNEQQQHQQQSTNNNNNDENNNNNNNADAVIIPLGQLHVSDPVHLESLHAALSRLPEVAHHHLNQHVFPRTMLFQSLKVSACGHELGSSILFAKRIGFSGTPSNLLPLDLEDCSYEPGSDGRIIKVLTNPSVTTAEVLPADWSPRGVLEQIAASDPPCNALIDVGALITNMDNEQVARFLLERLPAERFDAVVFLDSQDRNMALLRENRLVVPIAQCGVPLSRRFVFYDQVHCTGTDVKQGPAARAVITVGKDTVFRDYAQGAYRMRQIGIGQTLHVFVIPEVAGRIKDILGAKYSTGRPEIDIPAWLLLNSMRLEALQFIKLSEQEVANVFRKRALMALVQDSVKRGANGGTRLSDWQNCLRFTDRGVVQATRRQQQERAAGGVVAGGATSAKEEEDEARQLMHRLGAAIRIFREPLGFPLQTRVEPPRSFEVTLRNSVEESKARCSVNGIALTEQDLARLELVLQRVSPAAVSALSSSKSAITAIATSKMATDGATAEEAEVEDEDHRLAVLAATAGLNTEVVHEQEQEQEQEQEAEQEEQRDSAYSRDDEQPISWTAASLSLNASDASTAARLRDAGEPFYTFSRFRIRKQQPALDGLSTEVQLTDNLFRPRWFGAGDRRLKNVVVFLQLSRNNSINNNDSNVAAEDKPAEDSSSSSSATALITNNSNSQEQRFVAVSLAEAESLRWLVHRSQICNASSSFALRATMSNAVLDATNVFLALSPSPSLDTSDAGGAAAGSNTLSPLGASLFFRFFNNDMFFSDDEVAVMNDSVFANVPDHSVRVAFFEETLRLRRRHRNQWDDAPVAKILCPAPGTEGVRGEASDGAAAAAPASSSKPALKTVAGADTVAARAATRRLVGVFERNPSSREAILSAANRIFASQSHLPLLSAATLLAHSVSQGRTIFPAQVVAALLRPHTDPGTYMMITLRAVKEAIGKVVEAMKADEQQTDDKKRAGNLASEAQAVADKYLTWQCAACTMINEAESFECVVCTTPRPGVHKNRADHSPAPPDGYWSCDVTKGGCSKFNKDDLFYCDVCNKSRPSLASTRF